MLACSHAIIEGRVILKHMLCCVLKKITIRGLIKLIASITNIFLVI
jgi:hypothetical protein